MAFRHAATIGRRTNPTLFISRSLFHKTLVHHGSASSLLFRPIPLTSNQIRLEYSVRAISGTTNVDPVAPKKENGEYSPENWKVKMLYDGDCPLCMKEVNMLRERNKQYGTIKFVDVSSDEYSPDENKGLDYATVMGRIHTIMSDGTVVTDVEAFRKLYEAVGLGWIYAVTKYEPISTLANAVYGVWAKYRLQITGRPPLEEVLEARRKKAEMCNNNKTCKMLNQERESMGPKLEMATFECGICMETKVADMSFIEQYKIERDRQQKLAEEEEIRLRKELVPKAQPMPYFARPFIQRQSEKQLILAGLSSQGGLRSSQCLILAGLTRLYQLENLKFILSTQDKQVPTYIQ